ncbi:lachrymatory-factor synthase-like [Gastrolobium bilobum]|uniref:lachrymatory-factor synthase-like n=1 Tax=Gastrolobium bilobum TaxID=150636 RepID=UPI002AB07B91|nr:lachrymatory-factor synthase-like [Gastrolobium bilobum]
MTEESKSRWEGETSVELHGITAEQVWPLLEDFCNIHKWMPIETCYQVEGVTGQPGLIRYCATTTRDDGDPLIKWAKEKLLMIDPIQHCLIYEVVDSNMGFKSYVATLKLLPVTIVSGDKPKPTSCKIQWSFACDPVDGWTFDGLFSYIQFVLQFMAKKMELACSHQDKSL